MNPFDEAAVIEQLKAELKPEGGYAETWSVEDESADGTFRCVAVEDEGDRRWCRGETVIILHVPSGNYYAFRQDIGLTEYQENEVYADTIWRVEPATKVIELTVWKKLA